MAKSSNLFGVPVGSKGNVKNGDLNIQPLQPIVPLQARNLAGIVNPAKQVGATSPCGTDINIRFVPFGPRPTFDPNAINYGDCGPSIRSSAPTETAPTRVEPPVTANTQPVPTYLDKILDLINISMSKTTGEAFKAVLDSGVGTSPFRPEIILLSDFVPLYSRGSVLQFTDPGLFVDVMYQAQKLRQETLAKIVANISKTNNDTTADDQFKAFVDDYQKTINELDKDLGVISDIQGKIAKIRSILDVRQIPDAQYDSKVYVGLKRFAEEKMQYSRRQIELFSNTKLLAQMLFDFKSTMENYSVGLLDLKDPDRPLEQNPTQIDKTYTISSGFNFSMASLAANQTGVNATDPKFFTTFLSSLPSRKTEIIKILSVLLCKELAASKGLGNKDIQTILSKDYGSVGNSKVFSAIVGEAGNSIFDIAQQPNSLMSLLIQDSPLSPTVKILPFESKYIDADNNKSVYVPGSSYYADSIFDINSDSAGWNTKPIIDYVTNTELMVSKATIVLSELLGYSRAETVYASDLIKNIFSEMTEALNGQISVKEVDKNSAILASLVKISDKDNVLKNMLFQYSILVGMSANGTPQESSAFMALAQELGTVESLAYARLDSSKKDTPSAIQLTLGEKAFGQHLAELAVAIENRVHGIAITTEKLDPKAQKLANRGRKGKSKESKSTNIIELMVEPGNVINALRSSARTRSNYSIVRSFVDNLNRLFESAQDNGVSNFMANGLTRNSGLTPSTIAAMLYELCSAFYSSYVYSSFESTQAGPRLMVDIEQNANIRSVLYELARRDVGVPTYEDIVGSVEVLTQTNPKRSPPKRQGASTTAAVEVSERAKKSELYSLITKVADEQLIPANVLYILQVIKAYIRNEATATLSFFQQNKMQDYLVKNKIDSDKLEILQNASQLRVSMHVLDNIKSLSPTRLTIDQKQVESPTNKLILTDTLTKNEYSLIKLMMSESPYLPEANYSPEKQIKLMSVGIPSGFSKQLVDRVNVQDITSTSFFARQADIIEILVYKRDLRFEDVVFKPLTYTFDMSLFVDQLAIDSMSIDETMNFSSVVQKMNLSDYSFGSDGVMKKRLLTYSEIMKNSEYEYAVPVEIARRKMFMNHVVSYILDMYISLLTGLKVDETTFVQTQSKPERSMNSDIFTVVYTYVRDILNKELPALPPALTPEFITQTIQNILLNPNVKEEVKDYFRLFTYGTIAFNKEYVSSLVNQPKIFDRIFHIPVDLSAFEVDLEATLSTESGRQAFNQTYVQDSLYRTEKGAYISKNKTETDLVFEDYFVRIQTAIDKD